MLGKKLFGREAKRDDHPRINLKICSEPYRKIFDETQIDIICAAAYSAKCSSNVEKEREASCAQLKLYEKGEELVKKCPVCFGNEVFDDEGDLPDSEEESSPPNETESASQSGPASEGSGSGGIVYPDEFEYPE